MRRILNGRPVATIVLGGISVAAFLGTHSLARIVTFAPSSRHPNVIDDYSTFAPYIAEYQGTVELLAGGFLQTDWWRIFSGAFLHFDLRHMAFNMLLLFLLGRRLERAVGPWLFCAVYVVSLLGGSAGAMLHSPRAAVMGASGAVYGIMGATYLVERLRGGDPWRDGLGSLIIINVIFSFLIPGISIGGHLGGLAAGVAAAFAVGNNSGSATSSRQEPIWEQWPDVAPTATPRRNRKASSPAAVWALLIGLGLLGFFGALAAAVTWRNPLL